MGGLRGRVQEDLLVQYGVGGTPLWPRMCASAAASLAPEVRRGRLGSSGSAPWFRFLGVCFCAKGLGLFLARVSSEAWKTMGGLADHFFSWTFDRFILTFQFSVSAVYSSKNIK